MGYPPPSFRSGCWAVGYRSIHWVYYYQRESEAGAESQVTGCMMHSTIFHVQYFQLLNKQPRLSSTSIVNARTRHLNAYLTNKLKFSGFPHEGHLHFDREETPR